MAEQDLLLAAIEAADQAALDELYREAKVRAPRFQWAPTAEDFSEPELKELLAYWHDRRGAAALPHHRSVDPLDLRSVLGFLTWLEPIEGGADFRFRLYGSKIADLSGFDMTGKRISEMPTWPLTRQMYIIGHQAVMRRRQPLKSVHEPSSRTQTAQWTRLILPFADDSGAVERIMVANIPGEWRGPAGEPSPGAAPDFS